MKLTIESAVAAFGKMAQQKLSNIAAESGGDRPIILRHKFVRCGETMEQAFSPHITLHGEPWPTARASLWPRLVWGWAFGPMAAVENGGDRPIILVARFRHLRLKQHA